MRGKWEGSVHCKLKLDLRLKWEGSVHCKLKLDLRRRLSEFFAVCCLATIGCLIIQNR